MECIHVFMKTVVPYVSWCNRQKQPWSALHANLRWRRTVATLSGSRRY